MTGPQAFQIMNDVQRYMIDSTRLGIPVFTLSESLHGAVNDGCTTSIRRPLPWAVRSIRTSPTAWPLP